VPVLRFNIVKQFIFSVVIVLIASSIFALFSHRNGAPLAKSDVSASTSARAIPAASELPKLASAEARQVDGYAKDAENSVVSSWASVSPICDSALVLPQVNRKNPSGTRPTAEFASSRVEDADDSLHGRRTQTTGAAGQIFDASSSFGSSSISTISTRVSYMAGLLPSPNAGAIGFSGKSENAGFELEPGIPLPAAMVAPEKPEAPLVAESRAALADDFIAQVEDGIQGGQVPLGSEIDVYEVARRTSDERYRALYGQDAYTAQLMKAAMEAIGSP
jgi:hypothetical protein